MNSDRRDTTASAVSPAEAYFSQLARAASQPLLKRATGSIRFDVVDGDAEEHWYVDIDHGDLAISDRARVNTSDEADAVVRLDSDTFAAVVSGRVNAFAAVLRGDVVVDGDLGLVLVFQRLFPSPPRESTSPAGTTGNSGTGDRRTS